MVPLLSQAWARALREKRRAGRRWCGERCCRSFPMGKKGILELMERHILSISTLYKLMMSYDWWVVQWLLQLCIVKIITSWCLEGSDSEMEVSKIPFIIGSNLELPAGFHQHIWDTMTCTCLVVYIHTYTMMMSCNGRLSMWYYANHKCQTMDTQTMKIHKDPIRKSSPQTAHLFEAPEVLYQRHLPQWWIECMDVFMFVFARIDPPWN